MKSTNNVTRKGPTEQSCSIVRQTGREAAVPRRFCVVGNKNYGAKLLLATVGGPGGLFYLPRAWFSLDERLMATIWFGALLYAVFNCSIALPLRASIRLILKVNQLFCFANKLSLCSLNNLSISLQNDYR